MSDDTKLILSLLDRQFEKIDKRFDGIDERLDRMDERFDGIDERLDRMDERFDRMDERFDRMDERFDRMDERFDRLEGRVECLEGRVDGVKGGLKHLQFVIENEIQPHIQLLAEGHMMLNEKLDRALENAKETEELKTRVDALEAGFQQMQDKIDKSA